MTEQFYLDSPFQYRVSKLCDNIYIQFKIQVKWIVHYVYL